MPFIGQFCLTDLGDFSTSDLVNVYSNVDGYTNPINTEPILISYMTGDGCPFTLAGVPDETTQLYIINTDEDVCTYLPVQSSDLCENCSFGFTQYSAQSIGRLYVGLLSASCENNLTGYTIDCTSHQRDECAFGNSSCHTIQKHRPRNKGNYFFRKSMECASKRRPEHRLKPHQRKTSHIGNLLRRPVNSLSQRRRGGQVYPSRIRKSKSYPNEFRIIVNEGN